MGEKMEFEEILKKAKEEEITREEALYLFQKTQSWDRALQLFETANKVRDEEVGRVCKLMGFICCITRCTTDPVCKYCFRFASEKSFAPEAVLNAEELANAVTAIEERGIKRIELAGGTLWGEDGTNTTINAVEVARKVSNLGLWINNGPSFTEDDVFKFKDLGVEGIACNFETINENIFKDIRPGDSLEHRKKIVEATEKAELGIDNTLMIDLGEQWNLHHPYQEWVNFLFYFKRFNNFRILEAHPFRPIKASPTQDYPPGSAFEAAKTKAIGRLIFRDIDIAGADDPLGLMAGANLIMHCLPVVKKTRMSMRLGGEYIKMEEISDTLVFADNLPIVTKSAIELGMEIES
ncbi:MAG: radical SAM protein [Halobacteriota archaeon]